MGCPAIGVPAPARGEGAAAHSQRLRSDGVRKPDEFRFSELGRRIPLNYWLEKKGLQRVHGLAPCVLSSPALAYAERRPEQSDLHRIVRGFGRPFLDAMEEAGVRLPVSVERAMERFLGCGVLAHGFLRLRCDDCRKEQLLALSCKVRGLCPSCGAKSMTRQTAHIMEEVLPDVPVRQWVLSLPFELRPMVSLDRELQNKALQIFIEEVFRFYGADPPAGYQAGAISFTQRFGASLNLHVHFHVVAIDGLYVRPPFETELSFVPARTPSTHDVRDVAYRVHDRFIAHLVRTGRIAGDHPVFDDPPTWPIVDGSGQSGWLLGDEVVPGVRAELRPGAGQEVRGFSVHAGVLIPEYAEVARERLIRYACRPPFAADQVRLLPSGQVAFTRRSPKPSGETHIFLEPIAFVRRLTSQIPPAGQNLVRYHGILAPAARDRPLVVRRPRPTPERAEEPHVEPLPLLGHPASWASLMKRAYQLDLAVCPSCGGRLRVVDVVLRTDVIDKILEHLNHPTTRYSLESTPSLADAA